MAFLKSGRPSEWYTAIEKHKPEILDDFEHLLANFKKHFESSSLKSQMQRRLYAIEQTGSCSDYTALFYDIISHLDLTEETKILHYKRGLKQTIREGIAINPIPLTTLDALQKRAILIDDELHDLSLDNRLRDKKNGKNGHSQQSNNRHNSNHFVPAQQPRASETPSASNEPVPMDIDALKAAAKPAAAAANSQKRGKLTPEERETRIKNGLCLYCGKKGHVVNNCHAAAAKKSSSGSPSGNSKTDSK